jgi:hypothetical protein
MSRSVKPEVAVAGANPASPSLVPADAATQHFGASESGAAPLDRHRLVTAFALTPLLAGFYPAIFVAEPALMPLGLIVAYLSTVIFGVPLVYYFDRKGYRHWYLYILGGAACALPSVVIYALATLPHYLSPFGVVPAIGVLLWGASSGIVFWMIGVAGDSAVSLRTLFHPLSTKD